MKMVKLTQAYIASRDTQPVYINPGRINYFYETRFGTQVHFGSSEILVKETIDQIVDILDTVASNRTPKAKRR